jgi:hypothetical protein
MGVRESLDGILRTGRQLNTQGLGCAVDEVVVMVFDMVSSILMMVIRISRGRRQRIMLGP